MPAKNLNGQLRVADKAYDVQIAAPMDDFYDASESVQVGPSVLRLSPSPFGCGCVGRRLWLSRKP